MDCLRKKLEQAAFWDGWACVACLHVAAEEEDHERGDGCPECDQAGTLVPALMLLGAIVEVEADDPEGD